MPKITPIEIDRYTYNIGSTIDGRSTKAYWIDTDEALERLVSVISQDGSIAIDTEFHREKTYYPRLALVQLARSNGEVVLIDPFRVRLRALSTLFEGDIEFIFHAFDQDLAILERSVGTIPRRLYDTQISAGFLGTARAGLGTLLERFLGIKLQKAARFSDWTARPLTKSQVDYACEDVVFLHSLKDAIDASLRRLGRVPWVEEELARTLDRMGKSVEPDAAWLKIKECKGLDEQSKRVARSLAAWRETTARENDIPCRYILSDLAIATISHAKPRSMEVLLNLRGVDAGKLSQKTQNEIMEAIKEGLASSKPTESPYYEGNNYPRHLTPLLQLCQAWVAAVAQREQIDSTIVSSKDDLQDLISKNEESRLKSGWRYELVGRDLVNIVSGRYGVAVDAGDALEIVPLDHRR